MQRVRVFLHRYCGNGEKVRDFHIGDANGSIKRAKTFDGERSMGSKKQTGRRPPQEKGPYFKFVCKKLVKHDKRTVNSRFCLKQTKN